MKIWGTFKLFVGVLAIFSSLVGMMNGVNGSPGSWWGPATLGSAALLTIEGVFQLLSQTHSNFLIAAAAMIPVAISSLFGEWPARVWVFAAMLAFLEWTIRKLSSATGRSEMGTLVFSCVLCAALANTTVQLFRYYWNAPSVWTLGQIIGFMFPIALPWVLVAILIAYSAREVFRAGGEIPESSLSRSDPSS